MKTNYAPVKLPKQIKSALMGDEFSIKVDRDNNRIIITSYCQKAVDIICRLVKEQIIERCMQDQASPITEHGAAIIDQLIENQKQIEAGIPIEFYKKGSPKLERVFNDRTSCPSIYVGEYQKRRYWADGKILFFGEPVAPYNKEEKGNCDGIFPDPGDYNTSAQPIGFSESWKGRDVWLYDGTFLTAIRSRYYDLIMKNIPDPIFSIRGNAEPVLVFSKYEDGVQALVMPVRHNSIPLYIKQMFNEKFQEVPA